MNPTFEERWEQAHDKQKLRYQNFINKNLKGVDLSDHAKRHLLWICGLDEDSMQGLAEVLQAVKDHA